ncbi:MAG: hypothetical protein KDC48_21675 [Planctomycetes bacterium]|nr:hypothetical protein [Planctomycetota bacterium]
MTDTLVFTLEGVDHEIVLDAGHAPRTLELVLASLPQTLTIHCAKIAGCHVYWPTTVLARLERGTDIHALPAGSFLYYPDRQYLELTYDVLQAEKAAVNALGRLAGDTGWLRTFAERQRRESGRAIYTAVLRAPGAGPSAPASPPAGDDAWSRLRRARAAAWGHEPAEVAALLARDGLNIPFGPLITAEGGFRHAHELLWRLWNDQAKPDAEKVAIAVAMLELAIARVAGFCHMNEAGAVLGDGITCLKSSASPVDEVLAEVLLYCARLSAWLDLHVPWWQANELTREILGRP